jgi:hypothetical protein
MKRMSPLAGATACPDNGLLRAFADRELAPEKAASIDRHLSGCLVCRERIERAGEETRQLQPLFDALIDPAIVASAPHSIDPAVAYVRYCNEFAARRSGWRQFFRAWRKPTPGWIAAVCLLVAFLGFAPARTLGQKFLQMLRIQKLAVIPVDLSALSPNGAMGQRGEMMAQLMSDSVVVTMKPGEPAKANSIDEARASAGFRVRTLDALGDPQPILVEDEIAFHVTLDRDRIQAILDQASRPDIQVPQSVDGSTVAVHIPKSVRLLYGDCSARHRRSGGCMQFIQVPAPTVSVPPTLNMAALAEAALQLTGVGENEAHAFVQTVDWSSTLVIPIPLLSSSYRTISVDGVDGTFVQETGTGKSAGSYSLIWVKSGILYSLVGYGSADAALSAAASLH